MIRINTVYYSEFFYGDVYMNKNVEVLVACMNQIDDSLYVEMNLQSSAVFANQSNEYSFKVYRRNDSTIKLVSTADRGVGKNRNMAILHATGDYLIIADDDMVYKEGYVENVIKTFEENPKADIIVFELNYLNRFTKGRKPNKKVKRIHLYNSMRYGAARIAIKRESLLKSNIWFSLLYGGGAPYSCGEDALFIREAIRKGLKIYASPYIIADVKQEESSWFKGYNEKYYFDRGVWLANAFPIIKYPLALYYAYRLKGSSEKSVFQILMLVVAGIKSFEGAKIL